MDARDEHMYADDVPSDYYCTACGFVKEPCNDYRCLAEYEGEENE